MSTPMSSHVVWQCVAGRIVAGHGVASGRGGDARFPGGSIRMQTGPFRERGLDLSPYHAGTVNVSIGPATFRVLAPRLTLRDVRWHPTEPMEDFSFADARVSVAGGPVVEGLVYYPHPDTKPAHFQAADVLELMLPFVEGVAYGAAVRLWLASDQIAIDAPGPLPE